MGDSMLYDNYTDFVTYLGEQVGLVQSAQLLPGCMRLDDARALYKDVFVRYVRGHWSDVDNRFQSWAPNRAPHTRDPQEQVRSGRSLPMTVNALCTADTA